jgi:predicted TPR repeat methyltransferase
MAANPPGSGNSTPNASRLAAAQALLQAGRLGEAEAGLRECLACGDANAAGPLATLLLQQERDREAAELLEPAVRAAPANGELVVSLSVALRRLGRLDEALDFARRGCTLLPQAVPAWNALGVAALEAGRNDEALAAFESGLRAAPGHPALILHGALALRRLGRNEEALQAYTRVTRAFPQALEGWRGLAETQAALGQLDAALRSRKQARAAAPNDIDVAFELAGALLNAGRPHESAPLLDRLLQARPERTQGWVWLARARLKLGDEGGARDAFARARALDPGDPMIAHFHTALSGTLPDAVETDYIRCLFDDFAAGFEHTLVDQLAYDTPAQLARLLHGLGADAAVRVLDLGCGTGLMAEQLRQPGRIIDGVDLSPRMLERARAKGIYRDLHVAELSAFLGQSAETWDLAVATDVYIYIPDAAASFRPMLEHLSPGGWFGFSIERSAGDGTELVPQTGRYRQSPERIAEQLTAAGFGDIVQESIVVRLESGRPVPGALFVARRPP